MKRLSRYSDIRRALCLWSLLAVAALVLAGAGSAGAADPIAQQCVDQIGDPAVDVIACDIPFELRQPARDELIRITGGVIRDAGCKVSVGIARAGLFNALVHAEDIAVPAQPVQCDVETDRRPMRASFTLAPRVWFDNGRAVRATPGMGDVQGMSPLLALVLMNWINTDPQIEDAMVAWVNAYMAGEFN